MIKKIAFFSTGFAFNRQVRMKFYEKIFPKDIDIYLFTTDKYLGKEIENYQFKGDLKKTKRITIPYGNLKTATSLRKKCN